MAWIDAPLRIAIIASCLLLMPLMIASCTRSERPDAVIAYIRTDPGNREGAREYPIDVAVFQSGLVVACGQRDAGTAEVRQKVLSREEAEKLAHDLRSTGLGDLLEQAHAPPDGHYREIGIRVDGELRRYTWSGRASDVDTRSEDGSAFSSAWESARMVLDSAGQTALEPAADPQAALARVRSGL